MFPNGRIRRKRETGLGKVLDFCRQEGLDYLGGPKTPEYYLAARRESLAFRLSGCPPCPPHPELTILVPTLPRRQELRLLLVSELERQGLTVHWDEDTEISTGAKRNRLVETVRTPYLAFVDDDDWVSSDYGETLGRALSDYPGVDSVAFSILYMQDNAYPRLIRTGLQYDGWDITGEVIYRKILPWILLKTELQKHCPYPDVHWGEDRYWADHIQAYIQTQAVARKVLYHYSFLAKDSATNYNPYVRHFYETFPQYDTSVPAKEIF